MSDSPQRVNGELHALITAHKEREDDLREEASKRIAAEMHCIREVADLRAEHSKEIRQLESARLNAIRQVDVLAVSRTAEQQLAAVQTLAATTTSTADNIRTSVASTAAALAEQLANTVKGLTERIAALERSSYLGAGKEAVTDPAMALLITEVRNLRTNRATDTAHGEGATALWKIIASVVGVAVTVGSVLFALLK